MTDKVKLAFKLGKKLKRLQCVSKSMTEMFRADPVVSPELHGKALSAHSDLEKIEQVLDAENNIDPSVELEKLTKKEDLLFDCSFTAYKLHYEKKTK